jgi:hypothetical protein
VGRGPLDEEAIRDLEERHADIHFDWPRILRGDPDTTPDRQRDESPSRGPASGPEPVLEPINPAHAELGSEGLARLRARYAEVLAAIGRRVPNPERQEELKGLAERLNPDTWVTPDEVRTALDSYEAVLDTVRNAVGRRRRRPRSQDHGRDAQPPGGEGAGAGGPSAPESDGEPEDG